MLAQTESVFALANGHIGLRGNLDEGEPYGLPGTYLNSFYELRPLPTPRAATATRSRARRIVNVTNGKIIRLLVDDEPFDVRYGSCSRTSACSTCAPASCGAAWSGSRRRAQGVRVRSTRLVSFVQRAVAAILYEVEPLDGPLRVVVQSELVANEPAPPRPAIRAPRPRSSRRSSRRSSPTTTSRVVLVHSTSAAVCAWLRAWTMSSRARTGPRRRPRARRRGPRDVAADLAPGERLRVVKFLAYGWSSQRSLPALRDQVVAALAEARHTGWDGLVAAQRAYLDDFWDRADVELEGDAELQQAVRFALFHVLQAGARAEQRAIAAKGLTGPGYDGHTFWDTERFVLPVLTYTAPTAAADALRWRHSTLDLARERARQLGLAGAAFPWRTIRGQECSGYWPAGTAAFHIGADIADAVVRYQAATGDDGVRARGRARAAGRDRAALALARPPRCRRAASASTASPAPTSTARSPTTTSTPT